MFCRTSIMEGQKMQEQKETNYWIEFNNKFDNSKRFFSKSAYFTAEWKIRPYEQSAEFISPLENTPPAGPPERLEDDITAFSKNSRSRLVKLFSEISLSQYSKIYWVTLTYHHDYSEDHRKIKTQLDNFLKRLKRYDSELHYIWRMEYQKRGAPHFHFIFLIKKGRENFRELYLLDSIKTNWLEVKKCSCPDCQRYAVKSEELCTYRKAVYYVAKYVGKIDESKINSAIGRRWGYSRDIIRNQNEEVSLRVYQFLYIKKLLRDRFNTEPAKRDYITSTFKNPYSHYLFVDFDTLRDCYIEMKNTSTETIFLSLRREKLIPADLILDNHQIEIDKAVAAYQRQHLC